MSTALDVAQAIGPAAALRPLVVDLDGTLIRSDLLLETFFGVAGKSPWEGLSSLRTLAAGRAAFKDRLAAQAEIDPAFLPYDEAVLALIATARQEGREVYLVSASNERLVGAIADHLQLFTGWMASDATTNLSGERKAARLIERFGDGNFDYIGNDRVDLKVWKHAHTAIAVRASARTLAALERIHPDAQHVPSGRATLKTWLRLLRMHQYVKNGLLFVPLVTAHAFDMLSMVNALLGVIAFSFCASSVYLLNDLVDVQADRTHPTKHLRPLASGAVPMAHAILMIPILFAAAIGTALAVSLPFLGVLLGYCLLTTAYSFSLKRKMLVDVVTLAGLYSIRVLAGAVAANVYLSEWLLGFSMFIFMSLALIKRYIELSTRLDMRLSDPTNRNYKIDDLQIVALMAGSSGFNAVTVLALYISSPDVHILYSEPRFLWLLCPVIMYWIGRMLLMAHRRLVSDDPIVFAVRDRISLLTAATCLLIILAASVFP